MNEAIASAPPRWQVPLALQKRGKALLHQQCWLWGQDVKREDGNLLLAHGFERLRSPDGESGSSQYTLFLGDGQRVRLWGFGMYYGGESGIYINRFDFVPRAAAFSDGWQGADAMGLLGRSHEPSLFIEAIRWIALYERWVAETAGFGYRRQALSRWHLKPAASSGIAEAWQSLARALAVS